MIEYAVSSPQNGSVGCDGISRREFLRAGLGVTAGSALLGTSAWGNPGDDYVRDRAVVVLFLSGGASHIETFNPNMSAPSPYCSTIGEIKTTLPGVTFGTVLPELAKRADRLSIVRSFRHSVGSHEPAIHHVLTGGTDPDGKGELGFSMGSAYARLRGANHPKTGMPTYSLLNSAEVDPQYSKEKPRVMRASTPRKLGGAYAPFSPMSGGSSGKRRKKNRREGSAAENMRLSIERRRFGERRELLKQLDSLRYQLDEQYSVAERQQQQAVDLLLGNAAGAFDLSREDPKLLKRYDTSQQKIGFKKFRKSDLGHLMLTARRLVESGCGFVTVHSAGWDMHADGNNPGIVGGMNMLGPTLDRAVSVFLDDVQDRGLQKKILLVITGDFGRTPKINKRGGRDHWPRLCTLAFSGGGLKDGVVVGQSDRRNGEPAAMPVGPDNLMSTIMHSVFDVGKLRVARAVPVQLLNLIERTPVIPGLLT